MANLIGQLLVELGVNTAAFKGGLDKATFQARQFSTELKREFNELGNTITGLGRELGASFGPVGGAVDVVTSAFKTLSVATEGIGSGVAPALTAIIGVSAGVVGAIAAVAAGEAMLAQEGHEAVEALDLMSQKMGMSIDHLQVLKAAGESVNLPIQTMQMGMRRFSTELADMGLKSTKATDLLAKLGVTAKDPYEAMQQLAEGIKNTSNPTTQMNDAITIFGARMGLQMLPLLKKGKEGFAEYQQVVDEFGVSVGQKAVEATDKWKKSTVELHTAWEGMKIEFADSSWVNGLTTGLAKAVKLMGEVASGNPIKNPLLLPVFNDPSMKFAGPPAAGVSSAPGGAATSQENTSQDLIKAEQAARLLYMHIKEGGPAGVALADAMQRIKEDTEDSANSDYKDAAAIQAKIPALQEAARLEKQRNEMLLTMGRRTDVAITDQGMQAAKAYAAALKAQGAASDDAAVAETTRLAVEKFAAPYIEAGLEGTAKYKEELARFAEAASKAALAESAFSKAAEAGKILDEYAKKTETATRANEAAAEQTSKIGKAWASMDTQLDAAKRAVQEQGDRLTALKNAYGDLNPDVEKARELFGASVRALDANTAALQRNKAAVAAKITSETLQAEQKEIDKTNDYTNLLKEMPEAYAKAKAGAMDKARAAGLDADATELEVKAALALVAAQQKQAAAQNANAILTGPGEQVKQAQLNIDAIRQQSEAYLQEGGSVELLNKALAKEYQTILNIKAANGSAMDGARAAIGEFMSNTESMGTMMQKEITTGLNGIEDNFAQMIVTGKASWGSLVQDMEMQLLKFAESQVFTSLFKSLGSMLSNSGNGFFSGLGSMFGGGHADGGDMTPGKTYLVGERGPELFSTGLSGGSIIPNGKFGGGGGGGVTIIQNIKANDADSFKRSSSQLHSMAYSQAASSQARMRS